MSKFIESKGWLKTRNDDQWRWALNYLIKARVISNYANDLRALETFLTNWPNTAENREVFRNMKAAWRTKKGRDKPNGSKSYNFIMPESLQTQLNYLSKTLKKPKNKVVAELIICAAETTKSYLEGIDNPLSKKVEVLGRRIKLLERTASNLPFGRQDDVTNELINAPHEKAVETADAQTLSRKETLYDGHEKVERRDGLDDLPKSSLRDRARIEPVKVVTNRPKVVTIKSKPHRA